MLRIKGFESDAEDEVFVKVIHKGRKGKITLETDVENTFLSRSNDAGKIEITTTEVKKINGYNGMSWR